VLGSEPRGKTCHAPNDRFVAAPHELPPALPPAGAGMPRLCRFLGSSLFRAGHVRCGRQRVLQCWLLQPHHCRLHPVPRLQHDRRRCDWWRSVERAGTRRHSLKLHCPSSSPSLFLLPCTHRQPAGRLLCVQGGVPGRVERRLVLLWRRRWLVPSVLRRRLVAVRQLLVVHQQRLAVLGQRLVQRLAGPRLVSAPARLRDILSVRPCPHHENIPAHTRAVAGRPPPPCALRVPPVPSTTAQGWPACGAPASPTVTRTPGDASEP
jgi:hypothetical protein